MDVFLILAEHICMNSTAKLDKMRFWAEVGRAKPPCVSKLPPDICLAGCMAELLPEKT